MSVLCRMKVSLPDPAVLACFDTSACNSHTTSGAQQLRGPTSLLNNPAFVAEAGMAPASLYQTNQTPFFACFRLPIQFESSACVEEYSQIAVRALLTPCICGA